jgi:predicted PilT family ATPase
VPDVIVDELSIVTGAAAEYVESGRISGKVLLHRMILKSIKERLRRGDDAAIKELTRLRKLCSEL